MIIQKPLMREAYAPVNKHPHSRHRHKLRLLFLLLGILILLLGLQVLTAYLLKPVQVNLFETCSELLDSADYTRAIGFQPRRQQMAAVQIVKDLSGKTPAALVQVLTPKNLNTLDVYIFSCSMQNKHLHLTHIFEQKGLVQGSTEFSKGQTLITETLDSRLPPNEVPFLQPLQQNVSREYVWHENHFMQILFPGLYPVASRLEAEALQENFDNGQHMTWSDPLATTLQMSKDLLQWPGAQARLISQNSNTALVELCNQVPRMQVQVSLKRLVQPDRKGIWFVTDAHSYGILLTGPNSLNEPFQHALASPVRIGGANVLIDGHTFATLFDHTLRPIATASKRPLIVQSNSSYTATLSYNHLIPNQQGLLLVESIPQTQNNRLEQGQLLLTGVLLH